MWDKCLRVASLSSFWCCPDVVKMQEGGDTWMAVDKSDLLFVS